MLSGGYDQIARLYPRAPANEINIRWLHWRSIELNEKSGRNPFKGKFLPDFYMPGLSIKQIHQFLAHLLPARLRPLFVAQEAPLLFLQHIALLQPVGQ